MYESIMFINVVVPKSKIDVDNIARLIKTFVMFFYAANEKMRDKILFWQCVFIQS